MKLFLKNLKSNTKTYIKILIMLNFLSYVVMITALQVRKEGGG